MSGSGILALAGAVGWFAVAQRRRSTVRRVVGIVAMVVLVAGFALARVDIPALGERFSQSATGVRDRVKIWKDTVPIVRDFWLTGTGAGTYRAAMLVYQRTDRNVQFNQAHNHYLQAAAEGGIVLVSLRVAMLVALVGGTGQHLAADTSGAYWIQTGAACGLLAVALQSLWETGLVMPANAALAAVLAAIAVHERLPAEKSLLSTDAAEAGRGHGRRAGGFSRRFPRRCPPFAGARPAGRERDRTDPA